MSSRGALASSFCPDYSVHFFSCLSPRDLEIHKQLSRQAAFKKPCSCYFSLQLFQQHYRMKLDLVVWQTVLEGKNTFIPVSTAFYVERGPFIAALFLCLSLHISYAHEANAQDQLDSHSH